MTAAELTERSLLDSECNILTHLRRATSAIHQELDQGLDIIGRLCDPDTRVEMVSAYYRFHLGAENAIAPFLELIAEICFTGRRRSALIAEDLRQLGCCLPAQGSKFVAVNSRAEALGAFYVLEGSSLGGRMILRQLKRLTGVPSCLTFLDPYGVQTADFWRSFLNILEREIGGSKQLKIEAITGAINTFSFANETLCKPAPRMQKQAPHEENLESANRNCYGTRERQPPPDLKQG